MDIEKVITDYINTGNTDYAIMVTGGWGSGKTYFWNNTLKKAIENINLPGQNEGNEKKYSAARVSLFGLTDVNQIRQRMLEACVTDKFNNKLFTYAKNKKSVLRRIANGAIRKVAKKYADIDKDELSEIYAIACNLAVIKNTVFCFDDLERLNPKLIQDTLGYINSLIESEHVKIVILCNEEELLKEFDDNDNFQYNKYKEKVVRFTCQYQTDVKSVLKAITPDICIRSSDFISRYSDRICRTYEEAECSNIRTLKFNLDVLERIVPTLLETKCADIEQSYLFGYYLFLTMLYSIEYKRGISDDEFYSLASLNDEQKYDLSWKQIHKIVLEEHDEEEDEELSYLEKVKERFYGGNEPLFYGASWSILNYIKTGYLDEHQLQTEIQESLNKIRKELGSKSQQILKQMSNYLILEDEEFRQLADKALQEIRNHEYDYFSYPAIFSYLKNFIETNIWNGISEEDLYKETIAAMDAKESETKFTNFWHNGKSENENSSQYYNLIVEKARKFNSQLKEIEDRKNFSEKVFNLLDGKMCNYDEIMVVEPAFYLLNAREVFDTYKICKNANRHVFYCYIQKCLKSDNTKNQPFFEDFRDLLNDCMSNVSYSGVSCYLNNELLNLLKEKYPQKT